MRRIYLAISILMLTGCGASSVTQSSDESSSAETYSKDIEVYTTEADTEEETTIAAENKTLNIYCNTSLIAELISYIPDYTMNDKNDYLMGGKLGDTEIHFLYNTNDDKTYREYLDIELNKNDEIDMFVVESEYAYDYINSNATQNIYDIPGIDLDILEKQFGYEKELMSDNEGRLKVIAWDINPMVVFYNKELAKNILGSDDTGEVQKVFNDWEQFYVTAGKIAEAGYKMVGSYADTYRIYACNKSLPWIVDGDIYVDEHIRRWADDTKKLYEDGGCEFDGIWEGRFKASEGEAFCLFGTDWLINKAMGYDGLNADPDSSNVTLAGKWGVVKCPENAYEDIEYLCVSEKTDNLDIISYIINNLLGNDDVLTKMVFEKNMLVNNTELMDDLANNTDISRYVLGGINPMDVYIKATDNINTGNRTAYDKQLDGLFIASMRDYIISEKSYDDVLDTFLENARQVINLAH